MAGSATVGTAVVKLSFDGKGVKAELNGVEKEVSKASGSISNNMGNVAKKITTAFTVATAAAGAAVTKLTVDAVKGFAEYEQLVGGVETLFKDSSLTVAKYANEAFTTAGLSANEYMSTVTSFSASLLQGLGGDTEKAAEVANKAIVDMSDNANKMGTDMSMIQNAYQGFAKQNYMMLDNLKLGYGGTASEMARLINDSGVLGNTVKVTAKTVNEVKFDKIIEAIHVVQDNLGITGTTAKEASTTIQGSLNSMKSAWTNLVVGLSDETDYFGVLIDNLVSSVGTFAKNLLPTIEMALSGVAELIKELAPQIIKAIPQLTKTVLPVLLQAASEIVKSLVAVLPNLINEIITALVDFLPEFVTTLVNAMDTLLNTLLESLPIMIPKLIEGITNGIIALAQAITQPQFLTMLLNAALTLFMSIVHAIPQMLTSLIDALPQILLNIIEFLTSPETIKALIEAAVELFFSLVLAVPQILGSLIQAFGNLVAGLWNGITSMFGEFAANFGNFIGDIFKGAINGVISFIEGFVNLPIDALNGFIGIINGAFGWIGVNIGYIDRIRLPRLAQGGYADGATTAIIGEDGKEAVLPLENNTDNWAGLLASTLLDEMEAEGMQSSTGGVTVYMTNEINNEMDAQDIGRVLMQSIRRAA